ncbi:DNA polymerase II large subunit [Thermoplasmatales archaeon ex4484_30]|nr:MAG: DNA polymerase II large subunit [Thermoplasmatales archaeon ex4484_30]
MGYIEDYFCSLEKGVQQCYHTAREARKRGLDPYNDVEIPTAKDLADRVEELVGPPGIAKRIREYLKTMGREEAALAIVMEIAEKGDGREETLEQAVRTGLAILTEGVLVAPIEGISKVKVGKNFDGSTYVDLYFAGPIRSAGGTGEAMSVLIADVVRRKLGIGRYIPTENEIERYKEEVPLYDRIANLQYAPSPEEIECIVKNCPICINGEPTEDKEIMGKRDLQRVKTNKIRGGACLVIAEGLCLKAPKILKHVNRLKLEGWNFLEKFIAENDEGNEILPSGKYMKDLIAGRPVLSHPSRKGGFRLRYGRGRTCGLAATAIHPATMYVLDEFIALGTQMKTERPGKGTIGTCCDEIEGPMVLLENGDFIQIDSLKEAKEIREKIKEIIDLGEILIPFGEFVENNAILPQSSYCYEWWVQELQEKLDCLPSPDKIEEKEKEAERKVSEKLGRKISLKNPSAEDAFDMAKDFDIPLHPSYNLFWHDISVDDFYLLKNAIRNGKFNGSLILQKNEEVKEVLLKLGVLHEEREGYVIKKYAIPLLRCCGFDENGNELAEKIHGKDVMEIVSSLSGVKIMPKAPHRIGVRMGRPEKAAERTMRATPHVLFPVGSAGGRERLINSAMKCNKIKMEMEERRCAVCGNTTYKMRCDCGGYTVSTKKAIQHEVNLANEIEKAKKELGIKKIPEKVKGVIGLSSKNKTPEAIEKGLLRAIHGVYVFKDGTARFDMTNMPLTHFRPSEIGTSIEKLHELGYTKDWKGNPLESEEQICELLPQDVIPSKKCGFYMLNVANFIDDLLEKFYGIERFYNASDISQLVGHLVVGLSPHTSAGAVGRIIGFIDANVCCAHPFYHAAKRRNCDGDEDALMLLMDVLINFSHAYIPEKTGGKMDLPLVLATRISPAEIDKEAQNIDLLPRYPLKFYRATMRHAHPREIEKEMDLVAYRIGSGKEYTNFAFTHDTKNIADAPKVSTYKKLKKMEEKLDAQLELARKIRAVDESDVAARVIQTHFLPDLLGNFRAFTRQQVRCVKCNTKYRRVPLKGVCTKCGSPLTLTVHEKSIKKYLEPAKRIMEKFSIPEYTKQRIRVFEKSVESLFTNEKVKDTKLSDFW